MSLLYFNIKFVYTIGLWRKAGLRQFYLLLSRLSPPELVFVIAQAASFLVLNSPLPRMSMRTGKTLASITAWIWARLPAVMLDIVLETKMKPMKASINYFQGYLNIVFTPLIAREYEVICYNYDAIVLIKSLI